MGKGKKKGVKARADETKAGNKKSNGQSIQTGTAPSSSQGVKARADETEAGNKKSNRQSIQSGTAPSTSQERECDNEKTTTPLVERQDTPKTENFQPERRKTVQFPQPSALELSSPADHQQHVQFSSRVVHDTKGQTLRQHHPQQHPHQIQKDTQQQQFQNKQYFEKTEQHSEPQKHYQQIHHSEQVKNMQHQTIQQEQKYAKQPQQEQLFENFQHTNQQQQYSSHPQYSQEQLRFLPQPYVRPFQLQHNPQYPQPADQQLQSPALQQQQQILQYQQLAQQQLQSTVLQQYHFQQQQIAQQNFLRQQYSKQHQNIEQNKFEFLMPIDPLEQHHPQSPKHNEQQQQRFLSHNPQPFPGQQFYQQASLQSDHQPHNIRLQQSSEQKPENSSHVAIKCQDTQITLQESISKENILSQSSEKSKSDPTPTLQKQINQMSTINKKPVKPGKNGRSIRIETNYLKLDLGKLTVAYHYDVKIDPDKPKKYLRNVMEEFRKKHFNRYHPAFDGRKNLYSPFVLVEQGQELSDKVKILDELNGNEKIFDVKVQYANTVDLTPLRNINMTVINKSPQEALQCVEIVLRNAPSSNCIPAGRSFFTRPPQIINLGEGMEMYHGFYQSVIRGWKPLLNVDVAHKAFPKEIGLVALTIELLSNYFKQLREDELRARELDMNEKKTLEKFLKSLRVVYEIKGQPVSKREYRVNGIKDCPKRIKFRPKNSPEMTIEEYFARKKNYRLQYPLLPTIWVGNVQREDPILLPAELCTLLPGQVVNRKMTENQTSAMIKRAATPTTERKDKIMNSLRQTNHNGDLCIKEFGFTIGAEFEKVQARVLNPPSLEYFNRHPIEPARGVWRTDKAQFLRGAQIEKWTIISTCGPMDMKKLADMIYKIGSECGMYFSSTALTPFDVVQGRTPRLGDIENSLKKCLENKCDLVFVIIPDKGSIYSDVKIAAELKIGCVTQCIKKSTLMKKLNPATVNNILLKVNSKLNGTNHSLRVRPDILSVPCMIMGADVTHPSPDSQHIPSVAAVTASHDPKAFCYNISYRLQSPKMEIITDLQEMTKEHLLYFYRMNRNQKPQRIVFFRDGVSEGQFNEVILKEVTAIRNACTSLEREYKPSITFLVVQKRHHTRFFPMDKRDSEDRNFNVPAGTCVDTDITNPDLQNFYLVSHASIQGVAKPTKYCTLWDDNNMSNDDIEALTYHLCHLFSRCNRSVSYPAPTYYAHLAAARAKVYIEQINLDLNKLDYEQENKKISDSIRKNKPMFFV